MPVHLDQQVEQVGLLEAGDDVVILELSFLLGELVDVVGSSLAEIVVGLVRVDLDLSRDESLAQSVLLDHVLRGGQTGHDVEQKLVV